MASKFSILSNDNFGSFTRFKVLKYVTFAIGFAFIFRLGYLQIVKGGTFRQKSEAQAIKEVPIEPFRGNMFDRNGELLVHNEPAFTVTITPNDFKMESLPLLASILGVEPEEIKKQLNDFSVTSKFQPIKIYRDADQKIVSAIEEYKDFLTGVDTPTEPKRLYDFNGNFAHLLGYTREISKKQLEKMKYYSPGDLIGQTGLESSYQNVLGGKKGSAFVAVNYIGQKVESFNNGKSDLVANNGFDLFLGIDKKMQELAEQLMEGRRGAVIAMDPNNGEILAFVSKPDYDPRKFAGKTSSNYYASLLKDEEKPLFNRALQSNYPPGSTWKMLMAIAALNEGIITENTVINCPGSLTYGDRSFKCHGGAHGAITVQKAIQVSCNVFFYNMGLRLGMERYNRYGRMFGFGEKSFIDVPGEKAGILPSTELFNKWYGVKGWTPGRLVSLGIGQGELSVTPMQMAVYTAALATKGKIVQPHAVRSIKNNITQRTEVLDYASRQLPLNPNLFNVVQRGMYDVVNSPGGTGSAAKVPGISVCGKTGTAQNSHGQDHAWFVCFAPMENPKIAICVMVENAGFGGAISAPIAGKLMNGFFHPETVKQMKDSLVALRKADSTKLIAQ